MLGLLASVWPEFCFAVEEMGFVVIDELYDPKIFGNAYVVLRCETFDLMLTRDRGQRFVQIRRASGEWHYLDDVLEYVSATYDAAAVGSPPDLEKLAGCLRSDIRAVASMFAPGGDLTGLSEFERKIGELRWPDVS